MHKDELDKHANINDCTNDEREEQIIEFIYKYLHIHNNFDEWRSDT